MADGVRNQLSVAVIVRDGAEDLRLTLASVRSVANEIVVVDTGSTDRSTEVAREFGACVFEFPWSDNFAAARNHAWDQVTGDWVLWLDAGETVRESDVRGLRGFIDSTADRSHAYVLLVRVPPADAQAASEQIGQLRLLPNHPAIRFSGRVRESCTSALKTMQMSMVAAPFVIERGPREHDLRVKKQRAQRNIRLAESEQREHGCSAALWNCLGDALQTLRQMQRASECYRQALATAVRGSPEQLEAYYGLLTLADGESVDTTDTNLENPMAPPAATPRPTRLADSRSEDLLHLSMQALEVFPLDAQLLCFLAGHLQRRGHSQLALQAYRTAYQFGQVEPIIWHIAEIRDVAATCYSVCLQLLQREAEAIPFLEQAIAENPESIKLRRHLIDVHVNRGAREAALLQVGGLPKSFPDKEAFRSAVRGACYAFQKNWLAAKTYLQTAYGHGCRDVLCLKWLAAAHLASGDIDSARPMLEQWSTVEPRNSEPIRVLKNLKEKKSATPTDRAIRVDQPASLSGNSLALRFGAASSISTKK